MADLAAMRTDFKDYTGRFDLTNAQINGFINAGHRMLDTLQPTAKSRASYRKDIAAGDIKLLFSDCMAIESVWVADADGRVEMAKSTEAKLRKAYAEPKSDLTQNAPAYWAPYSEGLGTPQWSLTSQTGTFTHDYEDVTFGTGQLAQRGILFYPPADAVYTISVFGQWFSPVLALDTDVSYWSQMYPLVVTWAAAWALESTYRNSEGARDWMNMIKQQLFGVDAMLVEEEIAQANEMEG